MNGSFNQIANIFVQEKGRMTFFHYLKQKIVCWKAAMSVELTSRVMGQVYYPTQAAALKILALYL